MAFRFEMVSAVIEMGAAVGRDSLRCSRKIPVGRSRQAAARGYGLRHFCRNWHCRDGDRRNGIFWREHEYWARLFPGAYPPRAHWSQVFLGRDRVTTKAGRTGRNLRRFDVQELRGGLAEYRRALGIAQTGGVEDMVD